VPDDLDHARAKSWFATNLEPLITTDFCIDETLTLIGARKRPSLAIEVGKHFFERSIARIHFVSPQQFGRAWILFQQRASAGWSFTDCTSKIVIDDLNLKSAAALDRHFEQFGITIVP
jgi:predicted nucleic acid-binding protein